MFEQLDIHYVGHLGKIGLVFLHPPMNEVNFSLDDFLKFSFLLYFGFIWMKKTENIWTMEKCQSDYSSYRLNSDKKQVG